FAASPRDSFGVAMAVPSNPTSSKLLNLVNTAVSRKVRSFFLTPERFCSGRQWGGIDSSSSVLMRLPFLCRRSAAMFCSFNPMSLFMFVKDIKRGIYNNRATTPFEYWNTLHVKSETCQTNPALLLGKELRAPHFAFTSRGLRFTMPPRAEPGTTF